MFRRELTPLQSRHLNPTRRSEGLVVDRAYRLTALICNVGSNANGVQDDGCVNRCHEKRDWRDTDNKIEIRRSSSDKLRRNLEQGHYLNTVIFPK